MGVEVSQVCGNQGSARALNYRICRWATWIDCHNANGDRHILADGRNCEIGSDQFQSGPVLVAVKVVIYYDYFQ